MKKILSILLTSILTLTAFAEKDQFVGFFKGTLNTAKYGYPFTKEDNTVFGEVFRGPEGYRLKLLPAIFARAETFVVVDKLKSSGDKIILNKVGNGEKFSNLEGFISANEIDLKVSYRNQPAEIKLKRYNYQSPTLGLPAPAGAVVLFDGKNFNEWRGVFRGKECDITWKINPDGSMTIDQTRDAKGKKVSYVNIESKKVFGKLRMHIEFKFPCEYDKLRQARNNSGVIFNGMYEVQVLDSFGADAFWDECGSIYRQVPPQVNACLESGVWQTYDIEFTPAVFEGNTCVQLPKATVWLNGVLVQRDTPFRYPTNQQPNKGATFDQSKHARQVFIHLQDHTNPISFRNIWVKPL